ncbi:Alcohol dehydrogenase transcription factor Myb/SANT-like [Popillia japonica]|uniref:Alcohol dehydrogenase transcription factor Myb/SANT-like n=1 Tax=Popillia japonica TaxID=7064 RepID=A0AAW1IZP4_POPJA
MNITLTLRQTCQLDSEVRKRRYLYDGTHSEFYNRDLRAKAWDDIAAIIFQNQWNTLSNADKAKRAKYLQNKVTVEDLAEMNRSVDVQDVETRHTPIIEQPVTDQGRSNRSDEEIVIIDLNAPTAEDRQVHIIFHR